MYKNHHISMFGFIIRKSGGGGGESLFWWGEGCYSDKYTILGKWGDMENFISVGRGGTQNLNSERGWKNLNSWGGGGG